MSKRNLAVNPCRSLCSWHSSKAEDELFVCGGCGSQWMPTEPWTPIDNDGRIPPQVRALRRGKHTG